MEIVTMLTSLQVKLTKYLLNPKTQPYPLTASHCLKQVRWDVQNSQYTDDFASHMDGRVQGMSYYNIRLAKALKYLTVICEILRCLQWGKDAQINKREIYYKNVKIF